MADLQNTLTTLAALPQAPNTPSAPGPKVLLMGDSGTWKSSSLRSLPDLGITPFVMATEQNFHQVTKDLLGTKMHYVYIPAQPVTAPKDIVAMLTNINRLSYENLSKSVDPLKLQNNKLLDVGGLLNEFKCDCCKKSWGSPTQWGTDRALVFDGMSGMTDMAFALVVGNKPLRALPDYQLAGQAIKMILNLAVNMQCMFVLITHLDKEQDLVSGAYLATIKTVGNKLGPDLPRLFSDCIRAKKSAGVVTWDTADTQSTVVGRHIPNASGLAPDFKLLVSNWIKQGGRIEPTKGT